VATKVGETGDLVRDGETGYLISVGDVATLSQRLLELYDDSDLRARLGRSGRHAVAHLDRRAVANAYRETLTAPRRFTG
jgi:glycosyltransferase involved in cell wall biosynthesis